MLNKGDKILLCNRRNQIEAEFISIHDDSDEYITNVEDWLKVKINGIEYMLRGNYNPTYSSFRFNCKSMRNKGSFNIKKLN